MGQVCSKLPAPWQHPAGMWEKNGLNGDICSVLLISLLQPGQVKGITCLPPCPLPAALLPPPPPPAPSPANQLPGWGSDEGPPNCSANSDRGRWRVHCKRSSKYINIRVSRVKSRELRTRGGCDAVSVRARRGQTLLLARRYGSLGAAGLLALRKRQQETSCGFDILLYFFFQIATFLLVVGRI